MNIFLLQLEGKIFLEKTDFSRFSGELEKHFQLL